MQLENALAGALQKQYATAAEVQAGPTWADSLMRVSAHQAAAAAALMHAPEGDC